MFREIADEVGCFNAQIFDQRADALVERRWHVLNAIVLCSLAGRIDDDSLRLPVAFAQYCAFNCQLCVGVFVCPHQQERWSAAQRRATSSMDSTKPEYADGTLSSGQISAAEFVPFRRFACMGLPS